MSTFSKSFNALGIEQLDDTVLYQNLLHKNTKQTFKIYISTIHKCTICIYSWYMA